MGVEENIKKTRDIKASSLKTYMSALRTLKKKLEPDAIVSLTNTKFLHDFDKVMNVINGEAKITSKKNKLTAVIVALNSDEKKKEKLIEKLSKELKQLSEKYMETLKQQKKTDTQKNNWIEYKDLITVINKLMKKVKTKDIDKKDEISYKDFDLLQQLVILRTYLTFPLRNDFADMPVLTKKKFDDLSKEKQNSKNYLVITSKTKKQFYINQFKNRKFMGSRILDIPKPLNVIINLWLKHNKSGYYLVKCDKERPMNPNGITKFLNKIFRRFVNKKISTSMIRHIIISHDLKNQPTLKEKEEKDKEVEEKFLHTKGMNQLYRKVDE
jgi:PHD/YefM family antitoxin component YafN of YafNO toxin-antitoxin module